MIACPASGNATCLHPHEMRDVAALACCECARRTSACGSSHGGWAHTVARVRPTKPRHLAANLLNYTVPVTLRCLKAAHPRRTTSASPTQLVSKNEAVRNNARGWHVRAPRNSETLSLDHPQMIESSRLVSTQPGVARSTITTCQATVIRLPVPVRFCPRCAMDRHP